MELPGGGGVWLAPSPSPSGPTVPDRHDEHGVGTFNWPPAGTSTWPPAGTFSWPRTQDQGPLPRKRDPRRSLMFSGGRASVAVAAAGPRRTALAVYQHRLRTESVRAQHPSIGAVGGDNTTARDRRVRPKTSAASQPTVGYPVGPRSSSDVAVHRDAVPSTISATPRALRPDS